MYCSSNCIEHLVVLAGAGFSFYWLVLPFREINEVRLKKHNCIHLIPKWRPINYSFVCMFISPLCLIFTSKFFCVLYMLTRHQGLINMQTKE